MPLVYVIKLSLQWKDTPLRLTRKTRSIIALSVGNDLAYLTASLPLLSKPGPRPRRIMIDATHLKAYHTAARGLKKEMFLAILTAAIKLA